MGNIAKIQADAYFVVLTAMSLRYMELADVTNREQDLLMEAIAKEQFKETPPREMTKKFTDLAKRMADD